MEKRKLILVDTDSEYMIRLCDYVKKQAPDLELSCFESRKEAVDYALEFPPDLFILSDAFRENPPRFLQPIKTAWLTQKPKEQPGEREVFKYQKASVLLSRFREIAALPFAYDKKDTKVLAFLPCAGNVGVSTVAAAGCIHFSRRMERVLYLNLQQFGHLNEVFCKPTLWGVRDLKDVLDAVEENPFSILTTLVCVEADNIYSCDCFTNPLEASSADFADVERLLRSLRESGLFDLILIDCDLIFDERFLLVMKADKVVLVGDGTGASNSKIQAVCTLLSKQQEESGENLLDKCRLLYNKFVEGKSRKCDCKAIRDVGGVFLQTDGAKATIIKKIAAMNLFDRLLSAETEESHA